MNYQLNTQIARSADQTTSRISETGKYIGTITRAEELISKKGTVGVEFAFKADDGQTADYLSVWTKNAEGKELYGLKHLQAIMVCTKQRTLTTVKGAVEKYDPATGQSGTFTVDLFPELTGQRIGFLLQAEEYLKQDGTIATRMAIFGSFSADGEFTASEILDRAARPEKLAKMVAVLRDRKLSPGAVRPAHAPAAAQGDAQGDADSVLTDDIPF